jgi:16S rRNA G966 N2-methylase RsmD
MNRETVQEKYGAIARQVTEGEKASCCGPACCGGEQDPISSNLYSEDETAAVPGTAAQASLGCGNPTALAELRPGEVVLDLGSGGGIDVLLSARRVGPAGLGPPFDLVFMDPPYHKGLGERALACLREGAWLTTDALIVFECAADEAPATPNFETLDTRDYGAAKVLILRAR